MDFRTTSTKRSRRGFTLAEMMVGLGISSITFTVVAALMFYTGRSFAAMANYVDLDSQSRNALDIITRDVRQANRLIEHTSTSLVFEDSDGLTLSFIYDPDTKTLARVKDGQPDPKPLLEECIFLEFSIYQRNPRHGVYEQYPAATPDTCKLVQLHWVCSRTTLGTIVNTESVQSAKVVIRKQ